MWRDREIKEVLDKQVITGRVPQSVPIYAEFFSDKIPAGGSSADSRCPRCSPDVYGPAQEEMKAMFEAGKLSAHVDRAFGLGEAAAAFAYSAGPGAGGVGDHIGKIALTMQR